MRFSIERFSINRRRFRFAWASVFLCAALAFLCGCAFGADVGDVRDAGDAGEVLEAAVRSVDFYPSGARFVFQAGAAPGRNFEITLPGAFQPDSVRFLSPGDVSSLRVEAVTRDLWTPPALVLLKFQIDERDRRLKLYEARKAALEQTKAMIGSPLPENFGGDVKSLILYIEDAQAMRLRIENELVDLDSDIEKTAKELAALQSEYDRKTPDGAENAVRVQGMAAAGAEGPLLFEAFTYSAGWGVRYDMSLDSATGDIGAVMNARVRQNTGLDVSGEFAFHTRQPSFSIGPPQIYPLVVDLQMGEDVEFRSATKERAIMKQAAVNSMEPDAPAPQVSATLADVSVKGTGSLKGDGTPEDVALGRFTLKSVPVLVAIPEQSREAWIVASMDSIPEPLLPGQAELAVDGAATGKSAIPEYGMGQTYLPFGMASRLTAKKTRLVGKTGSSWLGAGILEDGYTLEITSGMDVEREVTVKDRLPLPANDKITLEVTKIDPAPADRDKENRLTWKIRVKPGETKKIVVEYTLRHPGETPLTYH
ncbi:MAG: DUF4139 domain-containing protein [Synergistaceae bacterium]|jgi:uncharacterized protein (TIGR02231 family)|nr:DUF4139 domain-containing protein [Synergistaceae bacterium]